MLFTSSWSDFPHQHTDGRDARRRTPSATPHATPKTLRARSSVLASTHSDVWTIRACINAPSARQAAGRTTAWAGASFPCCRSRSHVSNPCGLRGWSSIIEPRRAQCEREVKSKVLTADNYRPPWMDDEHRSAQIRGTTCPPLRAHYTRPTRATCPSAVGNWPPEETLQQASPVMSWPPNCRSPAG